jgi:hypothetical protein
MRPRERRKRRILVALTVAITAAVATASNYVDGFIPRLIAVIVVAATAAGATFVDSEFDQDDGPPSRWPLRTRKRCLAGIGVW